MPGNARPDPPRRRYRTKPLVIHPPTYVPLSQVDEERASAALAELLAPLFNEDGSFRREVEDQLGL